MKVYPALNNFRALASAVLVSLPCLRGAESRNAFIAASFDSADYDNGHSYHPMHGGVIAMPGSPESAPSAEFIEWHNNHVFRAA